MSTLGQARSPVSSSPWFAFLAMMLGVTAMAFGAYTVESPHAFATKVMHASPAPAPATVAPPVKNSAEPRAAAAVPITLEAVTIIGRAARAQARRVTNPGGCAAGWRGLASGPSVRQVREYCPDSE